MSLTDELVRAMDECESLPEDAPFTSSSVDRVRVRPQGFWAPASWLRAEREEHSAYDPDRVGKWLLFGDRSRLLKILALEIESGRHRIGKVSVRAGSRGDHCLCLYDADAVVTVGAGLEERYPDVTHAGWKSDATTRAEGRARRGHESGPRAAKRSAGRCA